ncbi:DUF5819 family protein [Streptomyces cylindrosporus]|uniref:DUF5819 family protein n=1 Tax=Streptomyces cylindrosporus TaxID=2927583 RepID=A0ABS9YDS3_9ACTN|nr:DUF5819 family protein [Streptomyces cylindrosporus]MCI3274766.1 DUF5819 family protein [Streptomyces cylindrosporus]
MDAYDTGTEARGGPDGPGGAPEPVPAPEPPAPEPEVREAPPRDPAAREPDASGPVASGPGAPGADARTGVAALSPRYQIGAALALAVVAVTVCVHIGMVFLSIAPSNTVTKKHGKAVDDWVYPEFEQNWKLFAPNPLQQNIAVQVRAEVKEADGGVRTTGWYDLSAEDGRAIDANPVPSHTQQNELRRAWDFFLATHDGNNRATGMRGTLSESYLRRIVVMRLGRDDAAGNGGAITQVQVRSRTTNVAPPKWSAEKISDKPMYRVLPWWPVSAADHTGGAE